MNISGNWRKSSKSFSNGNCVEVASDWRKASRSTYNGNCVEAASAPSGVLVRDTADRDGPAVEFPVGAWRTFLGQVPRGEAVTADLRPGDPIPPEQNGGQAGFVAGECGHRVARSEWRAGFRNCERCGEPAEGA